jgi:hypothetical protein
LIAKFGAISHGAKRISKTNERVHLFFQRHVTSNPPTHAFADQDDRAIRRLPCLSQRLSMRRGQLRQTVRPPSTFAHVGIIENRYPSDRRQSLPPPLHPRMRRRRAGARSKKKKRLGHSKNIVTAAIDRAYN